MGMISRFMRMFKADLHGVMDQMEDRKLLLRQSLREMEEEMDRTADKLRGQQIICGRQIAESERLGQEIERLDQDIAMAFAKERESIARQLIRRKIGLSRKKETLERSSIICNQECDRLREELAGQEENFQRISPLAAAYLKRSDPREFPWDDPLVEPVISDEEVELAFLKYQDIYAVQGGAS